MKDKLQLLFRGHFSLFKTLYLNFRVLPFRQAFRMPFIVSRDVRIRGCQKGSIKILSEPKIFMISFGFGGSPDLTLYNSRKSVLEIDKNAQLIFKGKAHFAPHFSVLVKDGAIMTIGSGFSCNNGCKFSCSSGIMLGDNCLLGGDVIIRDSDGHMVFTQPIDGSPRTTHKCCKPVAIGNHVWICNKSDILKGVTIGDDCIVSYGSLVVKSFPQNHLLIGGHPAVAIMENVEWER